jgi:hypothetical protein
MVFGGLAMENPFKIKAERCKNIWAVESALADINETLKLQFNSGCSYEDTYIQKLLTERDAYLNRFDQLRKGSR